MELNRVLGSFSFIEECEKEIFFINILNFDLINLNYDFFRNLETSLAGAFDVRHIF